MFGGSDEWFSASGIWYATEPGLAGAADGSPGRREHEAGESV